MKIRIPNGYDELLTKIYGNYMENIKVPSAHGETIFEPEIPYIEYFNNRK